MRSIRHTLVLGLAGLVFAVPAVAQSTTPSAPTLTTPYTVTSGDYAAIVLSEVLKLDASLNASPVVVFTPQENAIDVELFGSEATVEGARKSINAAWAFIQKTYLPYIKGRMNLALTDQNFRISYFYFSRFRGGSKLILTWNKGTLVVPSGSD